MTTREQQLQKLVEWSLKSSETSRGVIQDLFAKAMRLWQERDEARRLAATYFYSWWSQSDGPAREQRIWDEQMAETPWMLEYLKDAEP